MSNSSPEPQDEASAVGRAASRAFAREFLAVFPIASTPVRRLAQGTAVWRAGDALRSVPYVEAGALDAVVRISAGATEVVPVTFEVGEFAALSHLFTKQQLPFDLIASQNCLLRAVPVSAMETHILRSPAVLASLVRLLASRLRAAQARERIWLERSVQERLRATLCRVATEEAGSLEALPYRLVTTHEKLATRCGLSRAKLSHGLKLLEDAGKLRMQRGSIEIHRTLFAT